MVCSGEQNARGKETEQKRENRSSTSYCDWRALASWVVHSWLTSYSGLPTCPMSGHNITKLLAPSVLYGWANVTLWCNRFSLDERKIKSNFTFSLFHVHTDVLYCKQTKKCKHEFNSFSGQFSDIHHCYMGPLGKVKVYSGVWQQVKLHFTAPYAFIYLLRWSQSGHEKNKPVPLRTFGVVKQTKQSVTGAGWINSVAYWNT